MSPPCCKRNQSSVLLVRWSLAGCWQDDGVYFEPVSASCMLRYQPCWVVAGGERKRCASTDVRIWCSGDIRISWEYCPSSAVWSYRLVGDRVNFQHPIGMVPSPWGVGLSVSYMGALQSLGFATSIRSIFELVTTTRQYQNMIYHVWSWISQ